MEFLLPLPITAPEQKIAYTDQILLTGSCFTEHVGDYLRDLKFSVLQNPNGILFDPFSVAESLRSYVNPTQQEPDTLLYLNELWQSWKHHSRFSHMDKRECLAAIAASRSAAQQKLLQAKWLIITLGSAFSYRLTAQAVAEGKCGYEGMPVANCHRAPASWFHRQLMETETIYGEMKQTFEAIRAVNPGLHILLTVSPVRHIRDGVMENNRSKARLIEAVHRLVENDSRTAYFPSYEIVIDILRDYRFYDIDLVHPNYAATRYVMEQFMAHYVTAEAFQLSGEIQQVVQARRHRPFQPLTQAHQRFLKSFLEKARLLQSNYPFLDLGEEIRYFEGAAAAS